MKTLLVFSQNYIRLQIGAFLEKENDCILEENKENPVYILMALQNAMGSPTRNNPFHHAQPIAQIGGLCSGLTTLILYGLALTLFDQNPTKPRNDYLWFRDVLRVLRQRTDHAFEGLQEAEKNAIIEFISHVLFFQKEAMHILNIPQGQLDKNADEDTKGRRFVCEYTLAGTFTAQLLGERLPDIVHDGRIVLIGSCRHATGLIRYADHYYFVNVNTGIYTSTNTQEIADKIFEASEVDLDKDNNKNLSLSFQCFSLTGLSPAQTSYKAQKELLTGLPTGEALYHASEIGCIASAKYLLGDTAIDVNKVKDHNKANALYIACQNGHIEIVKLLLQKEDIAINQAKKLGATPLQIACQKDYKGIVELLLQNKDIDINQATETGVTSLHLACHKGHKEIVEMLLEKHNENAKLKGIGFEMVLANINDISDNNSKIAIKNKLVELIKCLPLEDLVRLSEIMYAIQKENIILDKMPNTNIDIKNLVFLRKEMGFYRVNGSHGNTTTWQEVMQVLKEQIKSQLHASLICKSGSVKYSSRDHYHSCLLLLNLSHERTPSNQETEDQKWIIDNLKVDKEQIVLRSKTRISI